MTITSPTRLYAAATTALVLVVLVVLFPAVTTAQQRYPPASDNMFSYSPSAQATVFIAFLMGQAGDEDADRHSPLYFRRRGGIGDVPGDLRGSSPYADTEYGYETMSSRQGGTGPWIRLSLNLSSEVENLQGGYRSFIVYAVSTSPNMMPSSDSDRSRVSALGGIPWSQIRAWAYLNWDQWRMPQSLDWERNVEHDERWHHFGANVAQPLLSGRRARPDSLFIRHVAWHYLRFITQPNHPERNLLSQLLDWRSYAEPRDFPLLRHGLRDEEGQQLPAPEPAAAAAAAASASSSCDASSRQPNSLQYSILSQFDWDNVDASIPEFIRHGMRNTPRPTTRLCDAALFSLRGLYFTTTKRQQPTPQPPPAAADIFDSCRENDRSSCLQAADLVKNSCDSITALHVDFSLGEKGTADAIGLQVGGRNRPEAMIPLVPPSSGTAHKTVKNHRVDLRRVFDSDVVPLRDIVYVVLYDTPLVVGTDAQDWTMGGITLTASCANLTQKMEMSTYSSVNEAVQNSSPSTNRLPQMVWRRDITREDWKIVVAA
ncbi:putative heat-labile enterotoxin [Ophiocordyceps polyrhachis-furcata BCC 54312]|uniref:Heat-labile enterotoxin n=1 Tax=Ophiocordyceps polyrhachis-furcata BCC 54312 TaxID=1330021 RepID=A0A367LAE9_9HYPO|nr:putative heat-labile enterotoxin [Ophiocordyceps polyrhachis-furcata BCC 54312]